VVLDVKSQKPEEPLPEVDEEIVEQLTLEVFTTPFFTPQTAPLSSRYGVMLRG